MSLNNAKLDDLRFQKQFLENDIRRKALDEQLNNAYLAQDTERVRALYPEYRNAFDKYIAEKGQYKEIAGKYYKQTGYQKTAKERIKAIDTMIKEIEAENEELGEDLQWARDIVYKHNQIYRPDAEWEKNKQKNWVYQIPEGLGTSVTSLGAGIVSGAATWAARAGALYLANSYMLSGGPYGAIANGAAAVIGATATVASTIWSRDQESRSEVAGAYNQFIQDWAQKNKISIDSLAEVGRQKLREKLGDNTAYSSDPNDSKYRDNQAVFEDMLAYNIPFDNEELDKIRETSRYQLQDVYNKNMALSAFDVAQATVMIPGVGRAFGQILGKMDITGKVLDKSVELIDNAIMWTNKKAGKYGFDIADAHKFSKYGIDPIVRLGATGLMEGLEETTQYMVSKQFEEDVQKGIRSYDDVSWYNPINLPKIIANDAALLVEGVLALAGLHKDPALNNDEELANNFKVGAAIGFIMGGGHQLASAKNNASSYDLGRNTARLIATEAAKAKDDVYKYIQYAEKAMGKRVSRDAFLDGVDQQIKNNEIPEGWTAEDLQKEKDNIRDVYDLVQYNKAVQGLPEDMRATGAAILKHSYDRAVKAEKEYNEIKNNPELSARIDEQTKQFMQDNGIDEKNLPLVRTYIEKFTTGGRNSNLWNGYASVETNENFICFNFRSLMINRNDTIANAQMLLVLRYLNNEIIRNKDWNAKMGYTTEHKERRKIILAIDEAHVFIDEKYPIALNFMQNLAKRIRKYDGMQIVITQNVKDFIGTPEIARKSTSIINVSQYSMIFSLAPNDMSDLCALYEKAGQINDEESNNIVNLPRGSAFFITGPSNRTNVSIVASSKVQELFENI